MSTLREILEQHNIISQARRRIEPAILAWHKAELERYLTQAATIAFDDIGSDHLRQAILALIEQEGAHGPEDSPIEGEVQT